MDASRKLRDYLAKTGGVQKVGHLARLFVVRANGSVLSGNQAMLALSARLGFVQDDSDDRSHTLRVSLTLTKS